MLQFDIRLTVRNANDGRGPEYYEPENPEDVEDIKQMLYETIDGLGYIVGGSDGYGVYYTVADIKEVK